MGYNPPTDANVKVQIQAGLDVNGPNTARLLSKEAGYDAAAAKDTNDVNTGKLVAAGGALATDANAIILQKSDYSIQVFQAAANNDANRGSLYSMLLPQRMTVRLLLFRVGIMMLMKSTARMSGSPLTR